MSSDFHFQLNSPAKITAILIAAIFSWLCYLYQIVHPVCCDALEYVRLAEQYIANGIIADPSGVRLYGYPLFVALNIKLAN